MSTRSNAWYADPANREKRCASMNAYMTAMVQLGRRYPDVRGRVYQQKLKAGLSPARAYQQGLATIRDEHKDEFRLILARLREA